MTLSSSAGLVSLVRHEMMQPVDSRVATIAAAIAARHPGSRSVLFYGSCLRSADMSGMLDFYLIVKDYESAYDRAWLAKANRLVPPNVFPFAHDGQSAKYAVLDETDFARECGVDASTVSVWARFSQPSRLVWTSGNAAADLAVDAVAQCAPTLLCLSRPLSTEDLLDAWLTGLALTYGAELRAESSARPDLIIAHDRQRYLDIANAVVAAGLPEIDATTARRRWRALTRRGKAMSVARLAKASLTFAGGIDYLAWKINRHAGTSLVIRPWQRRFPLLAAIILLPRLILGGRVR